MVCYENTEETEEVMTRRKGYIGEQLTSRELEILTLLARGYTHKAIALELGIGQQTSKAHGSSVRDKFDVSSTIEAVIVALKIGYLDLEEL